jgi:hypothetical protein
VTITAPPALAPAAPLTRSLTGAPLLTTPKSGFGGRGYAIPGRTKISEATGKPIQLVYPGVTTVLNQVAKPQLLQWVADQTAAYAVMNLPHLMQRTEEIGWGFLRWYWSRDPDAAEISPEDDPLRGFYNGVRDDRAELGTDIHQHVQADTGLDGTPHPDTESEEHWQMVEAWQDFAAEHLLLPMHSEFTVVNDTYGFAGTGDADWWIGCEHAGPPCLPDADAGLVRTLVDVKSSRHTWREHGHQIGGLSMGEKLMRQVPEGTEGAVKASKTEKGQKLISWWLEEDLPSFESYALLHIRPDDLDAKGNQISRFARLKEVRNLDLHRKGFLGAFALAEAEHALKAAAKSDGREWEGI